MTAAFGLWVHICDAGFYTLGAFVYGRGCWRIIRKECAS